MQQNISSKPKTSNINRSESYKERIHHKVRNEKIFLSKVFTLLRGYKTCTPVRIRCLEISYELSIHPKNFRVPDSMNPSLF